MCTGAISKLIIRWAKFGQGKFIFEYAVTFSNYITAITNTMFEFLTKQCYTVSSFDFP